MSSRLPLASSTIGPNSISSTSPSRVANPYPPVKPSPRPLPLRSISSYCSSKATEAQVEICIERFVGAKSDVCS